MNIKKISVILLVGCLFSGCMFQRLKKDLAVLDKVQELSGVVINESPLNKPVVVGLISLDDANISSYWLVRSGSSFSFKRSSGRYYLIAFEDVNEDTRYKSGECFGIYGEPSVIDFDDEVPVNIALRVKVSNQVKVPDFFLNTSRENFEKKLALSRAQFGLITTMDNPLFSSKVAATGLWTPVKFIAKHGIKIYFMEPFDAKKTPVLFVHGVNGHPGNWKSIYENLDRTRFQPWFVYYPSGHRLALLGKVLASSLLELELKYKYDKIIVIAHSMGGLVSRSMLLQYAENKERAKIPLYITIATPWAGHSGAILGVKYAPAVVPAWYDMVPQSDFLKELFARTLPEECQYHMVFAHKGEGSKGGGNNDGAVAIASQLDYAAQNIAISIYGIDSDHVGVLSDEHTIARVNALLEESVR